MSILEGVLLVPTLFDLINFICMSLICHIQEVVNVDVVYDELCNVLVSLIWIQI